MWKNSRNDYSEQKSMDVGVPLLLVCTDTNWSVTSYSTEPSIDLGGTEKTQEIARNSAEQAALDVQMQHLVSVFGYKRVRDALGKVKP